MKADKLSPRVQQAQSCAPAASAGRRGPGGGRGWGQGACAWGGAPEGRSRGTRNALSSPHNQLLKSSPSTKPGFHAASSKQLSRVSSPTFCAAVPLCCPQSPTISSLCCLETHSWGLPTGEGQSPRSPLAVGTAGCSKPSWLSLGSLGGRDCARSEMEPSLAHRAWAL